MIIKGNFGKHLAEGGVLDRHDKFSSFADLVRYTCKKSFKPAIPIDHCSSRRNDEDNWAGTTTFNDMLPLLTTGWPKGLDMISRLTAKYEPLFSSYLPRQDFGTEIIPSHEGQIVDVEKAVQGEPEDMLKFEESRKLITPGTRFQRMYVNTSYHCGISTDTVFMYGALIVALVNSLEGYGFRTELISRHCISTSVGQGDYILADTVIKRPDESPDMDKIAFVCAHPSYLRRILFAVMETYEEKLIQKYCVGKHYSYPANIYNDIVTATDLYFPKLETNYKLPELVEYFTLALKEHFTEEAFGA